MVGALLFVIAIPIGPGLELLAPVPDATVGALLLVAAMELARDRRLPTSRPSCLPVIGVTALGTVLLDPFVAMSAGAVGEIVRRAALRYLAQTEP